MLLLTPLDPYLLPLRRLSTPVCYVATTALMVALLGLRIALDEYLHTFPFLLFFPGIFVVSVVFNRGTGYFASVLSATMSWYFFMDPRLTVASPSVPDAVGLFAFLVIGLFIAATVEGLRIRQDRLIEVNQRLDVADQQKRVLLDDINHRIKNSLQSLVAMIESQRRSVTDAIAREVLDSVSGRMVVLAQVYDRLHLHGTASTVNLGPFIQGLCDDLEGSIVGLRPVALRTDVVEAEVGLAQAIFVGLIINELVTNALKHAFPEDRAGTVYVRFQRVADGYSLEVSDDGVGGETARADAAGTGRRLVRSLAQQLGGTYEEEGPPGTSVRVMFSVSESGSADERHHAAARVSSRESARA